jgi:NAD-dependent deacetylase
MICQKLKTQLSIEEIKYKKTKSYDKKFKPILNVFTGAGISQESGISTFRDTNGLWNNNAIEDVASEEGFNKNPELVLEFYRQRRIQIRNSFPNEAHEILCELEEYYEVNIITQNVDDLHERAGSKNIIHLHGEIMKSQSVDNKKYIYNLNGKDLKIEDRCPKTNSKLRPYIVWFGEKVLNFYEAKRKMHSADIFLVIGTSLDVYPAANLLFETCENIPKYIINPEKNNEVTLKNCNFIEKNAIVGMQNIKSELIEKSKYIKRAYCIKHICEKTQ